MGLAASQARFLNLTARKTNLEYEGQQINQQRTTLANESANYYNQMLTLSVPVPPATTSYQKVSYQISASYFDGKQGDTFTIDQVTGKDSSATVAYTVKFTNPMVMNKITDASKQPQVRKENGKYYVGNVELKNITSPADDDALDNLKTATGNNGLTVSNVYKANLGTEDSPKYRYFIDTDLADLTETPEPRAAYVAGSANQYLQGSISNVVIDRDANYRIQGLTVGNTTYAVNAITIQDEAAYEEAYNEYTYQTYLYQQQLEEINAQTSIIQAQDKKLELRLKQLDTEQNAISTEMESISSLIDKNVENSFKIFA